MQVHPEIHWLLENSRFTRKYIADAIGISPRTLYLWEYNKLKMRAFRVEQVAMYAEINTNRIPAAVQRKARELEEKQNERSAKSEFKSDSKRRSAEERAKEREEEREREAKRKARLARTPTSAARSARLGEIAHLGDPRNIPFPDDYIIEPGKRIPAEYINLLNFPDLVYEAKQTLKPYEVIFIQAHKIPHPSDTGLMARPAAWYTINGTCGKMRSAGTQAEALERAAELKAEDDAKYAELATHI